jgi:hypothetical protein
MPDTQHNVLTGANLHEPKGVATANANEVYVADGAASGAWQLAPINPHAEITLESNATATTVTTLGTYYLIGGTWVQQDAEGLSTSVSTGRIIIATAQQAGQYLLSCDLSMIASRNGVVAAFKFAKNGTVFDTRKARRKIGTGADVGAATASAIAHGAVFNDYFQVFLTLTGEGAGVNGDTVTITDATFRATLVGAS